MTALPTPAADRLEGERRRDLALELLRLHRAALTRRLQRAFLTHLLSHGPDTSDAVRFAVPMPPGIRPCCVGGAVRGLATLRLIHKLRRAQSVRPEAHGRDLPEWEVTDCAAAADWLAVHPELPTPEPTGGAAEQPTLWD